MSKSRYFLATPVKNEEENLPNLIHSVAEQTIKPVLWIIVDDGSTDNSPKIIEDATNRYVWVKSVRLKESPRDLTIHFASVIKTGLDFASEYCREHRIQYDYICFLDADMIIQDKDFFKKIIAEFENYDNAANRWEGKNKRGEMMPNGTYYYFITLSIYNTFYKGWVLLYTD